MNKQIFDTIVRLKRELIPDARLILFGSQARGNARPDSDWDLLALLNDDKKESDYEDLFFDMVLEGSKLGTYFNILTYTEKEWEKRKITPLYKNIERDKLEII
ncbi:MAG: nucleotidyltransferase domain-containing protein [Dysgonamonadaceae bacterium]|jgi:predicted nucleotidyltransferase|nr:nucleotidyltransferase domain-containing protein [Dysgonamonadaceae bacterium]